MIIEPSHDKTNSIMNMACAPGEVSVQHGHLSVLVGVLLCSQWIAFYSLLLLTIPRRYF